MGLAWSRAAVEVAVLGALAAGGVVGLYVWDGGAAADTIDLELPTDASLPPLPSAGSIPAATAAAPAAATTVPAAPGDVTLLPVPTAAVEVPGVAGMRSWMVTASTLVTVRDGYFGQLGAGGWVATPLGTATAEQEIYTVADAAGSVITLSFVQVGADVVVTAQQ